MVGIIGGGLANSVTLDAMGLDAIPSPSGDVASSSVGEGFYDSLGPRLFRQTEAMADRPDFAPEDAFGVRSDTGPMLEPAEAQDRFGLPGLTFNAPISQGAAQGLYDAKRAEAVRQDTINRRAGGVMTGQAAQFVYGLVGGMMDPLNLAVAAVPGVGEARLLDAFGEGLAGRMGARAVAGATAGAAGMAALEPLNYGLDVAEGRDWSMSDALRNIAFGGVLGGGLHLLGGAVSDALRPAMRERIEALDPGARETLLRGSLGQVMDDRPVTAGTALDAFDGLGADSRIGEWQAARDRLAQTVSEREAAVADVQAARDARNRGEAPPSLAEYETPQAVDAAVRNREAGLDAVRGQLAVVERGLQDVTEGREPIYALRYADPELNRRVSVEPPGGMPQTMLGRIRELGGLQDSGGELAARDLDKTPGMVRVDGMSLEDAGTRMAEEGYLPELARDMAGTGPEQVDRIGALLDAIDEQRSGRPRLREEDIPEWDARMTAHENAKASIAAAAEHLGITEREARGLSRGQLRDVLAEAGSAEEAHAVHSFAPDESEPWDDRPAPLSQGEAEQRWRNALDSLRAGVDDADAERTAIGAAADRAASKPSAKLADVQAEIEQLERQLGVEPKDDAAVKASEDGLDAAEAEASAVQQAASCLMRGGL